jgi:hypothetical protein
LKLKTNMQILSKKGHIHFLLNQKRDMDQIKMGIYEFMGRSTESLVKKLFRICFFRVLIV